MVETLVKKRFQENIIIFINFIQFQNSWTYPPFSGHIDKDGKIFARGSQDMKCVGIQYLEAIRKLKTAGVQLKRTLHICFVPGNIRVNYIPI